MFSALGNLVNRYWLGVLIAWGVVAILLALAAPDWSEVALDGDFDYLPSNSTSRRGIDLLQHAFPDEKAKSQIVLIFAREQAPLTKQDSQFAIDVAQRLAALQVGPSGASSELPWADMGYPPDQAPPARDATAANDNQAAVQVTGSQVTGEAAGENATSAAEPAYDWKRRVWTELTPVVGDMLRNDRRAGRRHDEAPALQAVNLEGHAVMVVGRLTTDMMATENVAILRAVNDLVAQARPEAPEGLEIGISGSAMIGGDMQASVEESLQSTETTTVILVLICLILIYRAPLLVMIPMATIGISLSVANNLVALLAEHFGPDDFAWSDFKIFTTTKIFVVVILFGAGTDFCLFLIARFKEELGLGTPIQKASGTALSHVGDALAASAFTTILGLATMMFAEYGKFVYSGPVVAVCLFVALIACITFAPALLRALGKIVFWPFGIQAKAASKEETALNFDAEMAAISPFWDRIARGVLQRPGVILWCAVGIAAFFILEGLQVHVTHDFMNELAEDRSSKQGTEMVRRYFAPGEAAPMTVVASLPDGALDETDGPYTISYLHFLLQEVEGVASVRSLYNPTGGSDNFSLASLTVAGSPLASSAFVSETEPYRGEVTQLHLVLKEDPFAREARAIVDRIEAKLAAVQSGAIAEEQPPEGLGKRELERWQIVREGVSEWKQARFEFIGTTPGMRDLERVTDADRVTIQLWVVLAVFAVIVVILRRPLVCVYLIITVLLSYWATIGMTEKFFAWYYGATFDGLDWKAPIFLFVILIAVGQDYNIYLTTRVFEEQAKYGWRRGLRRAMVQTGGIITSCGIIMAGTFGSMATGTLRGMIELGFALTLGVLLDTFFVRTVVVPCFFALMAGKEAVPQEATTSEAA